MHRAVHPILDHPVLFDDPLAFRILGGDRDEVLASAPPRSRVAEAGIAEAATYVGVDFEREDLTSRLVEDGFTSRPAVFVWLGVVPYLTRAAVEVTLRGVAGVPVAEVVLDHAGTDRDAASEERHRRLADRVAAVGEELTEAWAPGEMAER